MQATILDLRYKMKQVLQALERNETVTILYHGREKGTLVPVNKPLTDSVKNHPFFGMNAKDKRSVKSIMTDLRKPRYS